MKIQGAKVFITGSNRGIGLAIAKVMASKGAHLHLQMRTEQPEIAAQMTDAGAASVKVWVADLSSRDNIEKLIQKIEPEEIDILINNAGLLTGGLLEEQPMDEIYSMFQVNINALVQLTHALLPGMLKRKHGKVVNHSSVSSTMHFPCASTYAASKAAVLAFTNCLELELKNTGVSTLCLITPGIKTRMFDEIEVKYAKNFEIPKESISADSYAVQVCEAIEDDRLQLKPSGATGFGLGLARHLPQVFQKAVRSKFHR